jgi:formylmethanofuran dehydrogenase subunit E
MRTFEELFRESSNLHGHHCAGQVLGVRMAMVGCREVGIDEPKGCKKLIVYVEMDRCAADAVQSVTGCSLGKRTLKFLDYGKMAVTFVNTETRKAVRVLAKDDARSSAARYAPAAMSSREAQKQAYAIMPEHALFSLHPVNVEIAEEDMPGFRGARVYCQDCGEGIHFRREVNLAGRTLCIPCAAVQYPAPPEVLLIVGFKKSGKTTVIEKLVAELSARGYRVGTIKHHHSEFPATLDSAGTDTWRHRKAGANNVALMSSTEVAMIRDSVPEDSLDHILGSFHGTDIVLVEGFHEEPRAKIEVLSTAGSMRLCVDDDQLIALVGNDAERCGVPCFAPAGVGALADFIEREFLQCEKTADPASRGNRSTRQYTR